MMSGGKSAILRVKEYLRYTVSLYNKKEKRLV